LIHDIFSIFNSIIIIYFFLLINGSSVCSSFHCGSQILKISRKGLARVSKVSKQEERMLNAGRTKAAGRYYLTGGTIGARKKTITT